MLPGTRSKPNFTFNDTLLGMSPKKEYTPRSELRQNISEQILNQHHNQRLPNIIAALAAADVAVKFVDDAKIRQDYFYEQAENYHKRRYAEIISPPKDIGMAQKQYLPPIGQNFGYPEKRCFDLSASNITYKHAKFGDGTTLDARVGDFGQAIPASFKINDAVITSGGTRELPALKFFR